ncbi:MAG: hypothetical protein MUF48_10705, partial [Pirellulaceae bacterium]|nr:hypothetical protein [Pirellulaceae bacterium]
VGLVSYNDAQREGHAPPTPRRRLVGLVSYNDAQGLLRFAGQSCRRRAEGGEYTWTSTITIGDGVQHVVDTDRRIKGDAQPDLKLVWKRKP